MGSPAPLEGVVIVDVSGWLTGAGGTGLLADLGADVIKVELPGVGDASRGMPLSEKEGERGVLILHELANRNKRSIAIDLKQPAGREIFLKLVKRADVVTENFRPGVMNRLGLGYSDLATVNPSVILVSVSGFGSRGPEADAWVVDSIGHSRSGLLRLLSDPDGSPRYIGPHAIADQTGAIFFALAILCGLTTRALHGIGQHIELSQLSALMTLQTNPIHTFLATGEQPWKERKSYSQPRSLNRIYECGDGALLYLAAHRKWRELCTALNHQELAELFEYPPRPGNGDDSSLTATLVTIFRTGAASEWLARLGSQGVPACLVQDYEDLIRDPQVIENGYIEEVDHPSAGRLRQLAPPLSFSRTKPKYRWAAPTLGQHTDEILRQIDFGSEDISRLRHERIIQ